MILQENSRFSLYALHKEIKLATLAKKKEKRRKKNGGRGTRTRSAGALLVIDESKLDVQFDLFLSPLDEGRCHEVTEG